MRAHSRVRALLPVIALAAFPVACSSDDDPTGPQGQQPPTFNLTDAWLFEVTITLETGACAGNDEPPWSATLQMSQTGNSVTVTGDWHSDPGTGPHTFTGTLSGSVLTISGSYPEGGGTLTATYSLTVAQGGQSMTGTETWTWTDGISTCSNSRSTVVATRL